MHPPTHTPQPNPDKHNNRFRSAEAKRVAEAVLREFLQGKQWDEAQAPEWAPALAERVKQAVRGTQGFLSRPLSLSMF